MRLKGNINRSLWTIADQAVVSAGTFVVNVLLARHLSSSDYGIFSLLYSGLLTLQLFNSTLLFYPFSLRLVNAVDGDHAHLLAVSLILVSLLSMVLSSVLALVLLCVGLAHLILPALSCFLLWQAQEAMRRGLFSRFRHRSAALGDAVSYIGQIVVVAGLLAVDTLTIENTLYAMAATSAAAAVLQFLQLDLNTNQRVDLRQTIAQCWTGGGAQALATGLLAQARFVVFPWILVAASGPAAAAAFQAVANIVNIANPILIGLGNVVPQAATEARSTGNRHAWHVVRSYLFLTMPVIFAASAIVAINPRLVLWLLYGADSKYLVLAAPVRILVAASCVGVGCEFIMWFFHGVSLIRFALIINIAGFVISLFLTLLLVGGFGVTGGCIALLGANATRLALGLVLLTRAIKMEAPEDMVNRVPSR